MKRLTIFIILIFTFLIELQVAAQTEYIVQDKDNLYRISLMFDVPVNVLLEYNGMDEDDVLQVNQIIKIPEIYEVKPGDTYYGIARVLGVSVKELLDYNNRTENTILLAGESLQIPGRHNSVAEKVQDPPEETIDPDDNAEKNDSESSSEVPEAPVENYFWPHSGNRSKISGKLVGEQFSGNPGDSIFSVSSGSVIWVAPYRGYNKLIIVKAPDTHVYAYGGNDVCFVKVGDSVFPGMEIGRLGVNPHEGKASAFFFVYKNGKPVDPVKAPRI